jgi:hypothetical protein
MRRFLVLPLLVAFALPAAADAQIAAYSFDESGRAASDASGARNNARLIGVRRIADGRFGAALRFDGRRDRVIARNVRRLRGPLTITAWVKPARKRGWSPVVAAGRRALLVRGRPRGAGAKAGRKRARVRQSLRGWTHLAVAHDGRRLRVYVDGDRVATRRARLQGGGRTVRIGGAPGRWFKGAVDEVAVHDRALSGRAIRASMQRAAGGAPNQPPPPAGTIEMLSSVSKDGITWTFSNPVPVGRFVTGDPYVVGPATVTAIDPPPVPGRNGSVKNLPAADDESPFDDRVSSNRYEPGLRAEPPIGIAPGDSLVSSRSVATVGSHERWLFDRPHGSPVASISILTSVAAAQPADAFRPSYAGHGSPVFLARNLRRDLLPRLAPVAGTPSLAEVTEHFRRPWIDAVFFGFDAPAEYMPDYGREVARAVGMAGLLLTLNIPAEQKEPLLIALVQYGIDLSGLVAQGHPGWPAHGGHGSGRKLPIVLAATLLGEPSLLRPGAQFGEDIQTIHGQGWTGATALYAGHNGVTATGEEGPYEHLQPADWPGTMGEDYRRCCTSGAWIGSALTAQLIAGARANWAHQAFFDYADRWMTEDDTQALQQIEAQIGEDYSSFPQREAWDDFVTNMWRAYR